MATGTVKWFNDAKGYGFIAPDEGGKDLFVHHTNIVSSGFRTLTHGSRVEYEAREGTKGPRPSTSRQSAGRRAGGAGGARLAPPAPCVFRGATAAGRRSRPPPRAPPPRRAARTTAGNRRARPRSRPSRARAAPPARAALRRRGPRTRRRRTRRRPPVVSTAGQAPAGARCLGQQHRARRTARQHHARGQAPLERVQLGLVDDRDVEQPDDVRVDPVRRRRIDDGGRAVRARRRDRSLVRGAGISPGRTRRRSEGRGRPAHSRRGARGSDSRPARRPRSARRRCTPGITASDESRRPPPPRRRCTRRSVVTARAEEPHATPGGPPRPPRSRPCRPARAGSGRRARTRRARQPGRVADHVGADGSADGDEAAHARGLVRFCGGTGQAYRQAAATAVSCFRGCRITEAGGNRATGSCAAGRPCPEWCSF